MSLIRTLSPSLNGFSTCPVQIFFESELFVSSFGTSALNVLPISFVAVARGPSRHDVIRIISSVI